MTREKFTELVEGGYFGIVMALLIDEQKVSSEDVDLVLDDGSPVFMVVLPKNKTGEIYFSGSFMLAREYVSRKALSCSRKKQPFYGIVLGGKYIRDADVRGSYEEEFSVRYEYDYSVRYEPDKAESYFSIFVSEKTFEKLYMDGKRYENERLCLREKVGKTCKELAELKKEASNLHVGLHQSVD